MNDKTIIITGASDGIGAAAARQLHADGAKVVIVGRSPEKTTAFANELGVPYYVADFTKLSEVRTLAANLKKDYSHIDVLVNNAGGIFGKRTLTEDGHEKTLQVNHLAPFLLTDLLLDTLIASKASVINTSSVANQILSKFDIHDLEGEKKYSPESAYGNSKLENILFTKELNRRYHEQGISTAAFHPGNVATNFSSESSSLMRFVYSTFLRKIMLISSEKGADTLVWLASTTPGQDWKSGEYYVKRKISNQVHPAVRDTATWNALWEWSESAVAK